MHSILEPIKSPGTTVQIELSKQNLEAFQDHLTSLAQPDSVSEWVSRTSTMVDSRLAGKGSKKRKTLSSYKSIAESWGHKYTTSFIDTLYRLGVTQSDGKCMVPSVPGDNESWFETFQPNEASLVAFLCECLFLLKVSTSDEKKITILHEFSGPFKSHDLLELMRGDKGIKYPFIKRGPLQEESKILQTPAEEDLRLRSDFVFAASTNWVEANFLSNNGKFDIPCLSNNCRTCAVAVVAEVKATLSPSSLTAAKNQWSSLAYLQIMERISIRRKEPYVGDGNICQYGYVICGLNITIWQMGIKWNSNKGRRSEILKNYYTFPVQCVGGFDLEKPQHLENFVTTHKKILHWWLNGYLPSYTKDVTSIMALHPHSPGLWRIPWQEAVDSLGQDFREKPETECYDATAVEEQPARPPVGAKNRGETLQQDDTEAHGDGVCRGTTRNNTRCRKRIKIGKYCLLHQKEY